MQWLNEIFKPTLKCKRLGHVSETQTRRTYRNARYYAVDLCREERLECKRCGKALEEWYVVDREGFNSVTMPFSVHEELRKNGVVRIQ